MVLEEPAEPTQTSTTHERAACFEGQVKNSPVENQRLEIQAGIPVGSRSAMGSTVLTEEGEKVSG